MVGPGRSLLAYGSLPSILCLSCCNALTLARWRWRMHGAVKQAGQIVDFLRYVRSPVSRLRVIPFILDSLDFETDALSFLPACPWSHSDLKLNLACVSFSSSRQLASRYHFVVSFVALQRDRHQNHEINRRPERRRRRLMRRTDCEFRWV